MPKTPQSTLKAIKKYNEKSKYIQLKFTENQLPDFERIVEHCQKNGLSLQGYIKGVVKTDLDKNGI